MKKFFTLIAAALMAVGANAQTRTIIWEGEQEFGSSWPNVSFATSELGSASEGDKLVLTIAKADNAINTGWEWGPQVFIKLDWADFYGAKSIDNGSTNVEVAFDLTADDLAKIKAGSQLNVQGMNVVLSKIEWEASLEYEAEGKSVTIDEWGNILASEFDGYSDQAKVVFTYNTTGELTNADGSVVGWGTGSISSIDGKVTVANVPVKALGDNTLTFKLADLKEALASGPDSYDRYGLYWNMYAQGNSVSTRVSCVIYEVKKAEDKTVIGNTDFSNGWWTAFSGYYTIPANYILHVEFYNYTDQVENWDNWNLVVTNNVERDGDGYAEYFVLRADNYGWTGAWNNWANTADNSWFTSLTNTYNWDNFKANYNGAYVSMDIIRDGSIITINADVTGADGNHYNQNFVFNSSAMGTDGTENIGVFFTPQNAYMALDNAKTTLTPNTATGISAIAGKSQWQDGQAYNLAGQKVGANYKGIVIVNGKKILNK